MDVSGRGFTNWESPNGRAGRYKPEIVAHGFDVWGPSMVWTNDAVDVCKRHWGTSVAATLVGGAAALMIRSVLRDVCPFHLFHCILRSFLTI